MVKKKLINAVAYVDDTIDLGSKEVMLHPLHILIRSRLDGILNENVSLEVLATLFILLNSNINNS